MIQNAIRKFNSSIWLSLSPGGKFQPAWGQLLADREFPLQYRMVNDFNGAFYEMNGGETIAEGFIDIIGANGTYPDLDMMPYGSVSCNERGEACGHGHAAVEDLDFMMTLYMMFKGPLLFGGKLPDASGFVKRFLNNKMALAVNKESIKTQVLPQSTDQVKIWKAFMHDCPALNQGSCDVYAIFNKVEAPSNYTVNFEEGNYNMLHIWNQTKEQINGKSYSFALRQHGCAFFFLQNL